MEKCMMNLKEVCEFTGWGSTKAREILNRPDSTFTIRVGNRLYVKTDRFLEYLDKCAKYQITI